MEEDRVWWTPPPGFSKPLLDPSASESPPTFGQDVFQRLLKFSSYPKEVSMNSWSFATGNFKIKELEVLVCAFQVRISALSGPDLICNPSKITTVLREAGLVEPQSHANSHILTCRWSVRPELKDTTQDCSVYQIRALQSLSPWTFAKILARYRGHLGSSGPKWPKESERVPRTSHPRWPKKSKRSQKNKYCRVRNYHLIISKRALSCNLFAVNNSSRSQSCNSGRASKCWLLAFALRGYPGISVNIPQLTQSCKVTTVNISQIINPNT